ncbi:MAG: 50S ribosomal protein L4 [Candidatus Ancillula sp.]|jgi:large subunit ribosomal protein L4|nr:50S ribosomal protein L4 [Candidatus Ancillula sp.]
MVQGKEKSLPKEFFGQTSEEIEKHIPAIHQVVLGQLAAARQGTHKVKTRSEVSGGGKKPFRQKGTGRARQGSTRAPHMIGGGTVHGPVPRSYSQRISKNMKKLALKSALSDRANAGRVFIVDDFGVAGDKPSTKVALAALKGITDAKSVLILVSRPGDNVSDIATIKSLRNIDSVQLLYVDQINTYDVLLNDAVIFAGSALDDFIANNSKENK